MNDRTHCLQLMTEDGVYALFYHSAERAQVAYECLRKAVKEEDPYLEASDDEAMCIIIKRSAFHSVAMSPIAINPGLPMPGQIIYDRTEKSN